MIVVGGFKKNIVFFSSEMSYKDRSCSPILLESGLKSFLGSGHNYPLINGKFYN